MLEHLEERRRARLVASSPVELVKGRAPEAVGATVLHQELALILAELLVVLSNDCESLGRALDFGCDLIILCLDVVMVLLNHFFLAWPGWAYSLALHAIWHFTKRRFQAPGRRAISRRSIQE